MTDIDWDAVEESDAFAQVDDMLSPPDVPEPDVDEPSTDLLDKPRRPRNGVTYEKKLKKVIGAGVRLCLARESTLPDAAALLQYGSPVAESWGNLAASSETIQRAINVLEAGAENAVLAAVTATLPLVMQVARNHEPGLEPKTREIRIPGTKYSVRLPKLGIRVGLFRGATHDPDALAYAVLTNPAIVAALKKNGITVATPGTGRGN